MKSNPFDEALRRSTYTLEIASAVKENTAVFVSKTTRAGYTTSAIISAMITGKKILVVVPTNDIAIDTANNAAKIYFERTDADSTKIVRHIASNPRGCSVAKKAIEENEHLIDMPWIRSEDCEHCDECTTFPLFSNFIPSATPAHCSIKTMMEESDICESTGKIYCPDVVSITFDKLISLLHNDSKKADFFRKIISSVDIILFDEFGTYLTREETDVAIKCEHITTDRKPIVTYLEEEVEEITKFIETLNDEEFKKDYNDLLTNFINPFLKNNVKTALKTNKYPYLYENHLSTVKTWISTKDEDDEMVREHVFKHEAVSRKLSSMYDGLEFMMSMEDGRHIAKLLINLMIVMSNENLASNVFKTKDTSNTDYDIDITKFKIAGESNTLHDIFNLITSKHGTIFTDATMPSIDWTKVTKKQIHHFYFGDPLNTNESVMMVRNNIPNFSAMKWNKDDKYRELVLSELQLLISEFNPIIDMTMWLPSIKIYNEIYKKLSDVGCPVTTDESETNKVFLTYYNSTRSKGVESKRRFHIMVGGAFKPPKSYVHIAYTHRGLFTFVDTTEKMKLSEEMGVTLDKIEHQINMFNTTHSVPSIKKEFRISTIPEVIFGYLTILAGSIQHGKLIEDMWQAGSRAKDPLGKTRGIIYFFGVSKENVLAIKKQGGTINYQDRVSLYRNISEQEKMLPGPITINSDFNKIHNWLNNGIVDNELLGFGLDIFATIHEILMTRDSVTSKEVWLNTDHNLSVGKHTPDHKNGYFVGTIRAAMNSHISEHIEIDELLPGEFVFSIPKTPKTPPKKVTYNTELIINILRVAYLHNENKVTYAEIRHNTRKTTATNNEITSALKHIKRFGMLKGSSWSLESGKSKLPIIVKK